MCLISIKLFAKNDRLLYNLFVNCINIRCYMKQDINSDVMKKIEHAIEETKKKLFEIKKEKNPNLDWNKFSNNFNLFKADSDLMLKNRLFSDVIDEMIKNETDENTILTLTAAKQNASLIITNKFENRQAHVIFTKAIVVLVHFFVYYVLSVITFGLFSYYLVINIWYIFLLSLITSTLFMLCDLPSRSIQAFIFDPFLTYKLLITYILIMIFINSAFYRMFETSAIWIIFIPIVAFLHKILGRNIHKLWWRY